MLGVAAGLAVVGTVVISIRLGRSPPTPGRSIAKTTTSTVPPGPPYAVGITSLDVTEPAPIGEGVRSLPTEVRYPAIGPPGRPEQAGATADRISGPYPLVVFAEGYDISPEAYGDLLNAWTAAGYVVADPTFPFTAPSAPGGLDENDIVNHPADLRFVITSLLHDGAAPGNRLSGLIDPSKVAVIGHSDGGDVALAVASNSCCHDSRIKAAVILSGAELASFGGTYYATPPVPMLVAQGTDDDVNPQSCSVQLYDAAPQPKYYLSLAGQSHASPYLEVGQSLGTVEKVTIDFLDGYLRHSTSQVGAMTTDGSVPGLATLTDSPSLGLAVGGCPGAPQG